MTVDNTPSDNQRTAQERDVPRDMRRYTVTFAAEAEKRVIIPYDIKVMGVENAIASDILFYVTKIDSTTVSADLADPVITSALTDTIPASGVFPIAQQSEFNCIVLKASGNVTGAVTLRIGDGLPNGLGGTVGTAELTEVA
tara:strand:- start:24 stop:446 length:423 start_codon:yes stop_codon:yes gene_type:complete